MPIMPTKFQPQFQVAVHVTARDFLAASYTSLRKTESAANTILPHALKVLAMESDRAYTPHNSDEQQCTSILDVQENIYRPVSQFWLTCWSTRGGTRLVLDLVLSCTSDTLGDHPIFLYSNLSNLEIEGQFLDPRVRILTQSLLNLVPVARVFSAFGPAFLVRNFTKQWSLITGQQPDPEPLYAATFCHITKETLTTPPPIPLGDQMRCARLCDIPAVAQLCKEFSDTSIHYPLSYEEGIQEAGELIRREEVWIYETRDGIIPAVVAISRSSQSVTAITKVYTTPACRKRGYGERLVRRVASEILYQAGKQCVVLYVGHGNPAASVYHRIGFRGLGGEAVLEGPEEWLEIGFQETKRGHW